MFVILPMTLSDSDRETVWLGKSTEYYSDIIDIRINGRREFPL